MASEVCINEATTSQRGHSAFTLLEVVLSLALSAILMAALLSAVDLYRQVSSTGRDQAARAQLARAILRQMETDIRGCRFSAEDESTSSGTTEESDGTSGGDDEQADGTVTAEDAAATYTGNIGVKGDAGTLLVHLSRAPRPIDAYRQSGDTGVGASTSDLRSVTYFLAVPGAEGLSGVAGSLLSAGSPVTSGRTSFGLARLAGDPLSLEAVDAAGDVQTMMAGTQLVAAEVNALAFRYFDGAQWYDAWDSVEQNRLPAAVEIILGISQSAGDESGANSQMFRMVVALAAAEPIDTSDDLSLF